MTSMLQAVDTIDMQLSEIGSMIQLLLFMQEEATEEKREELRNSMVSILYVINDKVKLANGSIAAAYRDGAESRH